MDESARGGLANGLTRRGGSLATFFGSARRPRRCQVVHDVESEKESVPQGILVKICCLNPELLPEKAR